LFSLVQLVQWLLRPQPHNLRLPFLQEQPTNHISILVNGLTAFSAKPFNVTFCSVPGITTGSFATPINFGTGCAASGPVSISVGDLDGDG
jgi:hypothetical protein